METLRALDVPVSRHCQSLKRLRPRWLWCDATCFSGICTWSGMKSAQALFYFHFIFLIVHNICLSLPEPLTTKQEHAGNQCALSNMLSLSGRCSKVIKNNNKNFLKRESQSPKFSSLYTSLQKHLPFIRLVELALSFSRAPWQVPGGESHPALVRGLLCMSRHWNQPQRPCFLPALWHCLLHRDPLIGASWVLSYKHFPT